MSGDAGGSAPHRLTRVLSVEDAAFLRSSLAASLKGPTRELASIMHEPDGVRGLSQAGGVTVLLTADDPSEPFVSEACRSIRSEDTTITIIISPGSRETSAAPDDEDLPAPASETRELFVNRYPAGKFRR